jgi:hypothetical protein
VHIDHCDWFVTGLQVTYRSYFSDSDSVLSSEAPQHDFRRFLRYRHYTKETKRSCLVLEEGEYITNVSMRRVDHIVDRMTIVTNLRQVSFGGPPFGGGGGCLCDREESLLPTFYEDSSTNNNINNKCNYRRVVAFAGLVSEMSELVGCFSESVHWYSLKDLITTRALLEQGRARVSTEVKASNESSDSSESNSNSNNRTMMLQDLLLNANDDIFCHVLSFLVPSTRYDS